MMILSLLLVLLEKQPETICCLNIYKELTGQKPNLNKSAIFLPSWCNPQIAKAISRILGINLGSFPFTYLGAPISPKCLMVNLLNFLPNRVRTLIQTWNHSSISLAGKAIFLDSVIFAIPNYLFSVMHLPNSTLDSNSKLARHFLWGRNSNCSGFHSIGWTLTTLSKFEGRLGIRNCITMKHSLMAKHIFCNSQF